MVRRIMMKLVRGKKMNWAMYVEWTNKKQQWWKTPLVELMSDEKGNDGTNQSKGDKKNLVGSNSFMIVVIPKENMHYVEFTKKLF